VAPQRKGVKTDDLRRRLKSSVNGGKSRRIAALKGARGVQTLYMTGTMQINRTTGTTANRCSGLFQAFN
jgi:hypothetical protein